MGNMHERLTRMRKSKRRERRQRIGMQFEHMNHEELERIFRDHIIMVRRRQKQYATSLRGPERVRRLHDILKDAMLRLPKTGGRGEAFWRAERLLHQRACRHLATNLTSDARRLFKRRQVKPRTIARYTQDMAFYSRHDFNRETAAESGLLKLVG